MHCHNLLLLGVIVGFLGLTGCVRGAAIETTSKENSSKNLTNIDFGTALMNYYKAIQKVMPCGFSPLNIPVLAPFTMEFLPLNISNKYLTVHGNISNIEVTGLNKFRFIAFKYDAATNRTSYDIIFPELQLLAEYMIDTWALLAGFPINAPGQGLLNLKLIDLRLVGHFTLALSEVDKTGLRVSDFDSHFHLGNVLANNWNDLWDISANNFVNRWISEFMLMWTQQIQDEVRDEMRLLLAKTNDAGMGNVTISQLIEFFESQSKTFNMANCTLP